MFAVIYIPDFALQSALRLEPALGELPVALVDASLPKSPIIQLTAAARDEGVAEGLSVTQARARCAQCLIKVRSAEMEKAAAAALLQCAYDFSPDLEATADGTVTLDLKGFKHLALAGTIQPGFGWNGQPARPCGLPARKFGTSSAHQVVSFVQGGATRRQVAAENGQVGRSTPDQLHRSGFELYAQRMVEHVRRLHLEAQVGVAANPLLALYAARQARPVLVVGEEMADGKLGNGKGAAATAFLAELPIEAIEPSPVALHVLRKWGIRTVGAFVALGEEALTDRLGIEGRALFERATVRKSRPLRLARPEERYAEATEFEHEVETVAPLLAVLRRFLEQITVRMSMAGQVVETLVLRLRFAGGTDYTHTFKVPEPTGSEETLFRMLHTHLENFRSPHAIIGVELSGTPCLGRRRQFGLFESSLRNPNHFGQTLAQLSAIAGPERVGRPAVNSTYRADAFEMQAVEFERSGERGYGGNAKEVRARGDARPPMGVPLRRFRPALAATVERGGGRPVRFEARDCSGVIREARGPWRTSGDWWDKQSWSREEWDVQTRDGRLYRLFEEDGDWFVEGIYD